MIVECPVTFHQRIGVSKGGNVNNFRALGVGLRMLRGINPKTTLAEIEEVTLSQT
jgi:hypothetical protein